MVSVLNDHCVFSIFPAIFMNFFKPLQLSPEVRIYNKHISFWFCSFLEPQWEINSSINGKELNIHLYLFVVC